MTGLVGAAAGRVDGARVDGGELVAMGEASVSTRRAHERGARWRKEGRESGRKTRKSGRRRGRRRKDVHRDFSGQNGVKVVSSLGDVLAHTC